LIEIIGAAEVAIVMIDVFKGHFNLTFIELSYLLVDILDLGGARTRHPHIIHDLCFKLRKP
jgi:hypothetical protein